MTEQTCILSLTKLDYYIFALVQIGKDLNFKTEIKNVYYSNTSSSMKIDFHLNFVNIFSQQEYYATSTVNFGSSNMLNPLYQLT